MHQIHISFRMKNSTQVKYMEKINAELTIEAFNTLFETWKPRPKFEFINVNEIENKVIPHKLLY